MKRLFLILCFLWCVTANASTDYCTDGTLEGGYKMDDASGDLQDCSTNNNDLVAVGTPGTYAVAGKYDSAFDFTQDNNSGFYAVDIAALDDITTLTIGAWIAPDTDGDNNAYVGDGGAIITKHTAAFAGWGMYLVSGAGPVPFLFGSKWGGGTVRWQTSSSVVTLDGVYQHVALTYENTSTANDPIMYYNGVSQSVTEGGTAPFGSPQSDVGGELTVGIEGDGAETGDINEFDGRIDEVFVFSTALNSTQINELMTGGLDGTHATGGGGGGSRRVVMFQ